MNYTLWKKTEKHISGCVEDESESVSYSTSFYLIADTDSANFGDYMASDYGYQDCNYNVSYQEIAIFSDSEIEILKKIFNHIND